jgi:nucleotidyltransferase/DNA polymerase involved in DNA repair
VVGGSGRTVITTSSYEARAFGVKTGVAKWEALRCCPQLIIVIGDNKKYTYTSSRIIDVNRFSRPTLQEVLIGVAEVQRFIGYAKLQNTVIKIATRLWRYINSVVQFPLILQNLE